MNRRFLAIGFSALIYGVFFFLNSFLFGWLEFSSGVNWVYLPSGLRLLLVLFWGELGALGIALASALVMVVYGVSTGWDVVISALISGASPLLARFIAFHSLQWDVSLRDQSPLTLLKLGLVFALISSSMHQLWFFWIGRSDDFLKGVSVMWIGDVLGTLLLLYGFKGLIWAVDVWRADLAVND